MNRITNEQREAIVREAVAKRDSILTDTPNHSHSDYADGFDAGREQAYAECVMLALQWSAAREPEYGGMALGNFAEELERRSTTQQPALAKETGTATGRPHGCEARAADSASNGQDHPKITPSHTSSNSVLTGSTGGVQNTDGGQQ